MSPDPQIVALILYITGSLCFFFGSLISLLHHLFGA